MLRLGASIVVFLASGFVYACGSSDSGGSSSQGVLGGDASAGGDGSSANDASNGGEAGLGNEAGPTTDAGGDSSSSKDSGGSDSAPGADASDAGSDALADVGPLPDGNIPDVGVFDGGTCNALVNGGQAITMVNVPQDMPSGQGGTIALGLYYLTKWESYTGPGGASGPTQNVRKTAFLFQSSTQYLKVTADQGQADENDNRTYTTSGATLNSVQSCPTVDTLSSDYTATPTMLILYAGGEGHFFTRQ